MIKPKRVFAADFETTVYSGQTDTEVWSACICELFTDNISIFHSIDELYDYLVSLKAPILCYFHNLKFDGTFWLSFLLGKKLYYQAYDTLEETEIKLVAKWKDDKDLLDGQIKYSISDRGQWYSIKFKINGNLIEIRDSLKLLPFSLKKIGKSFGTKHKKLTMEYKGKRYAGCPISEIEEQYIKNDVYVLKEALEIMFKENHTKITIGSCCLSEYKSILKEKAKDLEDIHEYNRMFPNLYEIEINEQRYGSKTMADYIHKSYRGGWCYLVPQKAGKVFKKGVTADVNSLYPSMMSSASGNYFPTGIPKFWHGNFIPKYDDRFMGESIGYYFIRIKTRFYLKDGYLPCIQIKGNPMYNSRLWLSTSDIYNKTDGKYYKYYTDIHGQKQPARVELTLTCIDFELIKEHYDLVDFEILDGCYFTKYQCKKGLFDEYMGKYSYIKTHSTGAIRELAKLFLNNLYGKMGATTDSSFKIAFIKEDGSLGYKTVIENDKIPGYMPIGSAITSYARNFTIRHAQKNYHGPDKPGFIYADTDSIHCDLSPKDLIDIETHDTEFCKWKLESVWDEGYFVRAKTYIEHTILENLKPPKDGPFYNVKCAGLNDRGKDLFLYSIGDKSTIDRLDAYNKENGIDFTEIEKEFISTKRNITDFKVGIEIPGKLLPKNIKGGIVLIDTFYKMHAICGN